MKIVILDGYATNPGDLSWDELKQLGDCTIYDRTLPDEVVERAQGAEIVLTNKTPLRADQMDALPTLKFIGVLATGYNIVDTEAARERGILVSNIPAYSTNSVAQLVFAHLLNIAQQVQHHNEAVRSGRWSSCRDFCFWDMPLLELHGLKMGIVGLGNTGMATARIALGFGMEVYAYTSKSPLQLQAEIHKMELDELFSECDVVSLHCPLNAQTLGMVNAQRLQLMKSTAILINTARGPLVDESALADALNTGRLAAAGLDVLSQEPPKVDNPLLTARNCYLTPHIAWGSTAARQRLMQILVGNVKAYLAGHPVNIVNP
mgnify:CR=1 FL=1